MISFKDKIKEKEVSHAYCNGASSYRINNNLRKLLKSPYEENTKEDLEWLDGYYDAWYLDIVTGKSK